MLVFPVNTSDDVYGNVTEMYERFVLPHLHGKPPLLRSAGEYVLREATQGESGNRDGSRLSIVKMMKECYILLIIYNRIRSAK